MRTALVLSGVVLAGLVAGSGEARAETALERRLRQLEETVQQQQQEIRGLRRELEHEKTSGKLTEQKAESTKQQVEPAAKAWSAPDWLKRVTLFGDMRFRFEGFYNQPSSEGTKVTANNRERIRARIGLKFAPTDEVAFTVRATSGNPNDPISTTSRAST
jgi:type II secretory pathway pseudopilin PulG